MRKLHAAVAVFVCFSIVPANQVCAMVQQADGFREVQKKWEDREKKWQDGHVVTGVSYRTSTWGFKNVPDDTQIVQVVLKRRENNFLSWLPVKGRLTVSTPRMEFNIYNNRGPASQLSDVSLTDVPDGVDPASTSESWLLYSYSETPGSRDTAFSFEALEQEWQYRRLVDEYWSDKRVVAGGAPAASEIAFLRFEFSNDNPEHPISGYFVIDRDHDFRLVEISQTATNPATGDTGTESIHLDYVIDSDDECHVKFDFRQEYESSTLGSRGHSFVGESRRRKLPFSDSEFDLASYGIEMTSAGNRGRQGWFFWVGGLCLLIAAVIGIRHVITKPRV